MEIYITRNGKQFGPYSILDAQNMVRAGNLTLTDHAWHEGLTNWVPLGQVRGFSATPPAPPAPTPVDISSPTHPFTTQPKPKQNIFQQIGGAIAAVAVLLFKFKFILFAGLKTGLSMLFMIWYYSTIWGWPFAAVLVFLILIHEMGHVAAAKWLGMPVTAPLFIPFVGALILMKKNPRDAWTEALMAFGGPFAGCLGSWICFFIGLQLHADWLVAVALFSFAINLFNMIPIPPLDGGRMCSAISPWFWLIGILILGVGIYYCHSVRTLIVIGVIVILCTLPRLKETFFSKPSPEMQAYYNTHISNRLIMALLFLSLLATLVFGYWNASEHLSYLWARASNS